MTNKIILSVVLMFLVSLTFASAYDFKTPSIMLQVEHETTTSASDILATSLSHGIETVSLEIYEDNVLVKECKYASACKYSAVHTTPGVRNYYAKVYGTSSKKSATSLTKTVDFQNSAPVLNAIGNKQLTEKSALVFSISATDYNPGQLFYSASSLPTGATFDASTKTFSWTPTSSQAGTYSVSFSVTDSALSDSETIQIDVLDYVDSKAPKYSGVAKSPASGVVYSPSQVYTFSSVWADDEGMDVVQFTLDKTLKSPGTTFSPSKSGDTYTVKMVGLEAGTHSYIWSGEDEHGNSASYSPSAYVVNKASPELSLTPSSTVVEGTVAAITGNGCPSQVDCTLTRDGVEVTNGEDISGLAVGTYNYVYGTEGGVNYESKSVDSILTITANGVSPVVTPISPSLSINITSVNLSLINFVNGTYFTYNNVPVTVIGEGCPSELICTLYKNGIAVSSSGTATLAVGTYNYVYNTTGNENYSAFSSSATLTVNVAPSLSDGSNDNNGNNDNEDDEDKEEKPAVLRAGTGLVNEQTSQVGSGNVEKLKSKESKSLLVPIAGFFVAGIFVCILSLVAYSFGFFGKK